MLELTPGIEPVQERHADVKHDDIRANRDGLGKQASPIRDDADDFALRFEKLGTGFDDQPVIVGE
jgi:hypothetical protein